MLLLHLWCVEGMCACVLMLVHAGVCTWKPEQLAGGGSFLLLCRTQVLHSVGLIHQQTALTLRHPSVPKGCPTPGLHESADESISHT